MSDGRRHLLGMSDVDSSDIERILDTAAGFEDVVERFGRDRYVREAETDCSFGVDHLAGEQHLHRMFWCDCPTHGNLRRKTPQADVDTRSREFGFGRGEDQIAARRELAAGRRGDPLDAGNNRFGAPVDCHDHLACRYVGFPF